MPRAAGFFVVDTIGPRLDILALTAGEQVLSAMETAAERVEYYAKQNAPWGDITGDARSGLTASVFEEGGDIVLELAHSVDYGIWLELKNDGQYAIIMPTLEAMGPQILGMAAVELVSVESNF